MVPISHTLFRNFHLTAGFVVFKIGLNHKTGTFSGLLHSHKMQSVSHFEQAFLKTEMTDFSTLSYTSSSEIPTLSKTRILKLTALLDHVGT